MSDTIAIPTGSRQMLKLGSVLVEVQFHDGNLILLIGVSVENLDINQFDGGLSIVGRIPSERIESTDGA